MANFQGEVSLTERVAAAPADSMGGLSLTEFLRLSRPSLDAEHRW